ncbi:MAG: allophanate hydrolase subunit 2 family protein, partial [Rhodanobacteraceae bacterium]
MTVEVVKPGLLTTLQDAGRPGFAHLGVGRAGAFDAPALRIANALCGNPRRGGRIRAGPRPAAWSAAPA